MIKYVFSKGLNNISKQLVSGSGLLRFNQINKFNINFSNVNKSSFSSFEKSREATKFKSEESNSQEEDFSASPFDDFEGRRNSGTRRENPTRREGFGSAAPESNLNTLRSSSEFTDDFRGNSNNFRNSRDRFERPERSERGGQRTERGGENDENDLGRNFNHENKFNSRPTFRNRNSEEGNSQGQGQGRQNYADVKRVTYTETHVTLTAEEEKKFYDENHIIVNTKINEKIPKPLLDFKDLSFDAKVIKLMSGQFATPTAIQSVAWSIAQRGHNLVGVAETGSGKTLSFLLPAFNHILNQSTRASSREGPIVLIVAPTRELAMQIHKVASDFAVKLGFRTACLYGGAPRSGQIREVVYGVEMIVATPGRLLDLVSFGKTNFNRTSFVVLDEADRMLDMGFERDLRRILSQVNPDSQTLMWSATWPKEIVNLAEEFLKNYVHIKIGKSENGLAVNNRIKQNFIFTSNYEKNNHFDNLIEDLRSGKIEDEENSDEDGNIENRNEKKFDKNSTLSSIKNTPSNKNFPKTILFTNKKMKCESLVKQLDRLGLTSDSIHGDKSQRERDYAFTRFKKDEIQVLVATDVAARGLDVSDVKVVINYDFPNNLEDYVHRIGRTGRSGKTGISYAFFTSENYPLIKQVKSFLIKAEQEIPEKFEELSGGNYDSKKKRGGSRSSSSSSRGGYSGGSGRGYSGSGREDRY
jgi:ATP-dependent RNA helicase DDX5/DBP2